MVANTNAYTLLSNASATGSAVDIPAGKYHFNMTGTFSSTTATLQFRPDSARDWSTVDSLAVFTAAGNVGVYLGEGQVRVSLSGGSPSGLYAYLLAVP